MKLSRFNLRIFLDEAQGLCDLVPGLREAASRWIDLVDRRDKYGINPQEEIADARAILELKLARYRDKMATVYDFQGDRGLVNFEPTGMAERLGVSTGGEDEI